jgi:arabinogalactan endo-1,4-beta-galactosidase
MMTQISGGRGLGMVYWEPAWIPIQGVENFTSWANQTFFTYEGQVIPSLFTFNAVK